MSETKQNKNESNLTDLGVFWKKEKNGKSFLSGKVKLAGSDYTAFIFKNNKTKPNQPDYRLVISDLDENLMPESSKPSKSAQTQSESESEVNDDIPF